VIFPGGTARAVAHTLQDYYASLHRDQTTAPWQGRMLDFDGLNRLIGTPELLDPFARACDRRGGDPVVDPQGHAQGRGPPAPRQEPVAPTRMTVTGAGLCLPTPFALLRELRAS
jgi:hypothetical protein